MAIRHKTPILCQIAFMWSSKHQASSSSHDTQI